MQAPQSMSQDLIYTALYASLELTDQILQIWLTMTFAVIVSTYVAGKRFDRPIYLLMSGLYALASAIQLVRFCSTGYQTFISAISSSRAGSSPGRCLSQLRSSSGWAI